MTPFSSSCVIVSLLVTTFLKAGSVVWLLATLGFPSSPIAVYHSECFSYANWRNSHGILQVFWVLIIPMFGR